MRMRTSNSKTKSSRFGHVIHVSSCPEPVKERLVFCEILCGPTLYLVCLTTVYLHQKIVQCTFCVLLQSTAAAVEVYKGQVRI